MQPQDDLNEREKIMKPERESNRSNSAENAIWKRLWTSRETT